MRISNFQEAGKVNFPPFKSRKLSMHAYDIQSPDIPELFADFEEIFQSMNSFINGEGKAFLTIHEKSIKKGNSHRRPGRHIDGNYIYFDSWGKGGGGGWLTAGKINPLTPDQHAQQYCSETGGTIMASSNSLCRAWRGEWEGTPNQGGDCSNIDISGMEEVTLKPNTVYFGNHFMHESRPADLDVDRTFIRITLPRNIKV